MTTLETRHPGQDAQNPNLTVNIKAMSSFWVRPYFFKWLVKLILDRCTEARYAVSSVRFGEDFRMAEHTQKKPIGRPRGEQVENAARRRKQLVEAAIDSIVELGMSATTLATVAKAAGLSQGVAVFYFKTKENLLVETLNHHYEEYDTIWRKAIDDAGPDPIDRLTALVFADLDPDLCSPRNLALWNSYWGEAAARPRFATICDKHDRDRYDVLTALCTETADLIAGNIWTPVAVADALDSMTDGMWIRLHITPNFMDRREGRRILAKFLATVYPSEAARILRRAESYE